MAASMSTAPTRAMINVITPSPSIPLTPPSALSEVDTTQFTQEPASAMTAPTAPSTANFFGGAAATPPPGMPAECIGGGAVCAEEEWLYSLMGKDRRGGLSGKQ